MRVLVTGSSGLIGTALVADLAARGDAITRLVRRAPRGPSEVRWDPAAGTADPVTLAGFDAVVHLAGASIASGRWTPALKARLWDSRVRGTRLLVGALGRSPRPPRVLISASAVGYYGDRGDEILTEESGKGEGFLADLAQAWEQAALSARAQGIRVVLLRNGLVLSRHGGALAPMLLPFRLGLGAVLGSGRSWWSWIAIDDLIGVIRSAIDRERLEGPVNAASPRPVTNETFSRTLGAVLHRPVLLRAPRAALRLALGEMADQALLMSTRVAPAVLARAAYRFAFPELEGALRHVLAGGAPQNTTAPTPAAAEP